MTAAISSEPGAGLTAWPRRGGGGGAEVRGGVTAASVRGGVAIEGAGRVTGGRGPSCAT